MNQEITAMEQVEEEPSPDLMLWSQEDVCDSSCGHPCTPEGCHDCHPSGIFRIEGPDWADSEALEVYGVCTRNLRHARLIAAAPKLLAACQFAAQWLFGKDANILYEAIAEATGVENTHVS